MSATEQKSDGVVEVVVSNHNLNKGWDVIDVRAHGRSINPIREGEFASKEEALAAGFERGHAAVKADNTPPEH